MKFKDKDEKEYQNFILESKSFIEKANDSDLRLAWMAGARTGMRQAYEIINREL